MIGTTKVFYALLFAIVASAQHPKCSKVPADAKEEPQSFNVLTDEANITADVTCTWTIKTTEQGKITVYLIAGGTAAEKQCVHVKDTVAKSEANICGIKDSNTFTSTNQEVTVTYPKTQEKPEQVPNFRIFYMLANNDKCANPPPQANIQEQSFDIVKNGQNIEPNLKCKWTITAPEPQKILVYLPTDGNSPDKQCVHVEDSGKNNGKDICSTKDSNMFTSSGQVVTVSYPKTNGKAENMPSFKVMYTIAINEKCANPPSEATREVQSFDVLRDEQTITAGVKCVWTITAPKSQKVTVYLSTEGTEAKNQCVHVKDTSNSKEADICGVNALNTFTSTGQAVTVTYPKLNGEPQQVPNFKIFYMIANNENCANPPPQATEQEQSFDVLKSGQSIEANVICSWTIAAPESRKVKVHLATGGTAGEKQCVHVKDTSTNAEEDICGVSGSNVFTSTSPSVRVLYPKKTGTTEQVPNFKIMYMIAGAHHFVPWITVMSSVFLLSRMLLP